MKNFLFLGALLLVLQSCSSSPDVKAGLDGINKINIRGENVADTQSNAHKQAQSYCKDQKKTAEFLSDETFEASSNEVNVDKKLFKKGESVAVDIKFKCN